MYSNADGMIHICADGVIHNYESGVILNRGTGLIHTYANGRIHNYKNLASPSTISEAMFLHACEQFILTYHSYKIMLLLPDIKYRPVIKFRSQSRNAITPLTPLPHPPSNQTSAQWVTHEGLSDMKIDRTVSWDVTPCSFGDACCLHRPFGIKARRGSGSVWEKGNRGWTCERSPTFLPWRWKQYLISKRNAQNATFWSLLVTFLWGKADTPDSNHTGSYLQRKSRQMCAVHSHITRATTQLCAVHSHVTQSNHTAVCCT